MMEPANYSNLYLLAVGEGFVGQTPWSAPDPPVGLLRLFVMPEQPAQGVRRRPGCLPHKERNQAAQRVCRGSV